MGNNRCHKPRFGMIHATIQVIYDDLDLDDGLFLGLSYLPTNKPTKQPANHLPIHLSIYLSIHLSIYLSAIIYLSIHPSIYVYVGKWLSCWLTPVCRVYHIYLFVYLSTVYICNASSAICTCIYWASIDLWLCTVWCMCTTKCNYLWTEYLVFIYITLQ